MPRFFVRQNQISDGIISIVGDDAHHISRSLRMAVGEHITVSDMQSNEYECVLEGFLDNCVLARIISEHKSDTEPCYKAVLYQALPKGEKLDYIIQKSVECGVFSIVTFESERCIAKEKDPDGKKLARRQRIALEAAKQSGRGQVPEVRATLSFDRMLEEAKMADIVLFCYEGERTRSLKDVVREGVSRCRVAEPTIAVIIGSEGGFSVREVERALACGFETVGLGKRILRTETASGFVLSSLVFELEL